MPSSKPNSKISEPEYRQDLITGDWVIIAESRGRRPDEFSKNRTKRKIAPLKNCPFENLANSDNENPVYTYPNLPNWELQIIPNKYPSLKPNLPLPSFSRSYKNIFTSTKAYGYHELIISKNHYQNFPNLPKNKASQILLSAQTRYKFFKTKPGLEYAFMFHNWGPTAGASVFHPHYQLVGLSILPTYISHSLAGSKKYHRQTGRFAYSDLIIQEKKHKQRIIFENKHAISFTNYVSKEPFDFKVFPKKHSPFFEIADQKEIKGVAEVLQKSLLTLEKKLKDPDYNFFIHSAPLKNQARHNHYHWHLDVVPKISVPGGIEIGTGLEITSVDPDKAASFLKK